MVIRKLLFILIILAAILIMPLTAQGKETLAVLDFTTEAVSKIEMGAIVEFLSAELFNTDKYIVIDVSQRETILKEMEFSLQGCSDDTCALEIGKMLSAEMIVTGNLSKVGSRYLMSVKLLQTETSRTMGTANGKYKDLDELIDGLENIAFELAGMDEPTPTVVEDPEPEPVVEPEIIETAAVEVEKDTVKTAEPEPTLSEPPKERETKTPGTFNIPSFIVSALGAGEFVTSGVFSSLALTDRIAAEDAYEIYMNSVNDLGALYSGDGDSDYEGLYNRYESKMLTRYITGGLGGAFTGASFFIGDSYMSFGGKIAWAAGAAAYAAGNVMSVMASNHLINSLDKYEDYMAAGDSVTASTLFDDYTYLVDTYQLQQYISYGLWGAGGLATIGSWLIPGEKTQAAPGFLEKVIMTAGSLLISGGNFTSSMSVNARFNADDVYDDYMSAGSTESASTLYATYQNYQDDYKVLSYISYGLWGAGAAAVIGAMFMPSSTDSAVVADTNNFSIRPALTGFGVEVYINLK